MEPITYVFTAAKGGVGCSTSAVNGAHWPAKKRNEPTLLFELDRQGDCAKLLGLDSGPQATHYLDREIDAPIAIQPTLRDNLMLIPANGTLETVEETLVARSKSYPDLVERTARRIVAAGAGFRRLIVDARKTGKIQEAALYAADVLIIPTMLDYASAANTIAMVNLARQRLRDNARIVVLPIGLDGRSRGKQDEVIGGLKKHCRGDGCHLSVVVADGIPFAAAIKNAGLEGQTIWEHEPHGVVAKAYDQFFAWLFSLEVVDAQPGN